MPQRTITGPIVDAGGVGIASGELHVTPLVPAGESTDGFVVKTRKYPIVDGQVAAPVVVPGSYRFDVMGETGNLLRTFSANVGDISLVDITLKEVYDERADPVDVPPATIREGDSILRLGPGAGTDWLMLTRHGGELLWGTPPHDGDMTSAEYDPQMRHVDVYDRANHTGSQAMSTVTGLTSALGLTEYASLCDRRTFPTTSGAATANVDMVRTLNTIRYNNSGLSDAELLNTEDSSVKLLPGRVYVGHAEAPAGVVGAHFVSIKSTDAAITIVGPPQAADPSGQPGMIVPARVEFRIAIAANAAAKHIQLLHRCRFHHDDSDLGFVVPYPGMLMEFASLTIFSRPI